MMVLLFLVLMYDVCFSDTAPLTANRKPSSLQIRPVVLSTSTSSSTLYQACIIPALQTDLDVLVPIVSLHTFCIYNIQEST
jgi:hypothetical protein